MASLKRDVQSLVDLLCRDHGCEARLTGSSHWWVTKPDCQPVSISRTPSDHRVLKNIKGDIRRNFGVDLSAR